MSQDLRIMKGHLWDYDVEAKHSYTKKYINVT